MDGESIEEQVYVAMGSNLGDRDAHLAAGLAALRATAGIEVVAVSPLYETDPVGPPPQGPYLNGAIELATTLTPDALLERLLAIEVSQGRTRGPDRNAPRTLDLDLLLYGDRKLAGPDLEVPHPRLEAARRHLAHLDADARRAMERSHVTGWIAATPSSVAF